MSESKPEYKGVCCDVTVTVKLKNVSALLHANEVDNGMGVLALMAASEDPLNMGWESVAREFDISNIRETGAVSDEQGAEPLTVKEVQSEIEEHSATLSKYLNTQNVTKVTIDGKPVTQHAEKS